MLSFRKGTDRSTPAYTVKIGSAMFFISYETVMAVSYHDAEGQFHRIRRSSTSRTTTKHLCEMRCIDFDVVENEDEFEQAIEDAVIGVAMRRLESRLTPSAQFVPSVVQPNVFAHIYH